MQSFLEQLKLFSSLSENELQKVKNISIKKSYNKRDALLTVDQVSKKLYFINEGLLKVSFFKEDKEFVMKFFSSCEFCAVLDSLLSHAPSQYSITAIQDTTLIEVDYQGLMLLSKKSQSIEKIMLGISSMATKMMMSRIRELLETEGKERYFNFLENNGHLVNQISLGDLSGYLGISQVSLSRIRSKIYGK